jgi:alpha-amylase
LHLSLAQDRVAVKVMYLLVALLPGTGLSMTRRKRIDCSDLLPLQTRPKKVSSSYRITIKEDSMSWWRILKLSSLMVCLVGASPAQGTVFVHLFEWTWNDIAQECEDFLGPQGYFAAQISPPNEHRILLGRPWYERYQPVSYKLTSRSGTRQEFVQMVQRCHKAGVRIYADAVINHMASCRPTCDAGQPQFGNKGIAGSTYTPGEYQFDDLFDAEDRNRVPGALDAFKSEHFHHGCTQVTNWNDPWQVQNCELERLADLATEREDVRNTIANYLVTLFALGIDGLRIDAAKHFPPADLNAILTKTAQAANVHIENTNINPNGARKVLVYQEFIGTPPDPDSAYANGKVSEFEYGRKLAEKFLGGPLNVLNSPIPFGENWGLQGSLVSIAFIDNHDNQRGHGGGGQTIKDIRNNLTAYTLANIFMLAWPYGYPNVMSSYRFGNGEIWSSDHHPEQDITAVAGMPVRDDFLGPPHNGAHNSALQAGDYTDAGNWTTRRVWINHTGTWRNTCFDSGSKWMCEHRWRPIANMVGFRNAVNADWRAVANWWTNGNRQIAFGRGSLGFLLINAEPGTSAHAFGPESNGWIQTGLPAGKYCDVIHSNLATDETRCLTGNGQEVTAITVFPDGKANIPVQPMDAVALHIGARLVDG